VYETWKFHSKEQILWLDLKFRDPQKTGGLIYNAYIVLRMLLNLDQVL